MQTPAIPPGLAQNIDVSLPADSPTLRTGTWLIILQPKSQLGESPIIFDGTLRIAAGESGLTASADIYQREDGIDGTNAANLRPPSPSNGIPIFKRSQYRMYWLINSLTAENGTFYMTYQIWTWVSSLGDWASFPQSAQLDFKLGDLASAEGRTLNQNNIVDNGFVMKWVSSNFRKICIEIDTVGNLERPLDDGTGRHNWTTALEGIADVTIHESDTDIAEIRPEGWSLAEMHETMMQRRDTADIDSEWRYYILVVKIIEETERGIMFDTDATDSDNCPREGICIATDWVAPTTGEPDWGESAGQRWGSQAAPFFRTAVHELGHAFGLQHNDAGYMNTSDAYAYSATTSAPFPSNLEWFWKGDDIKRLQHWPDVYVRPGGIPFGAANDNVLPQNMALGDSGLHSRIKPTPSLVLLVKPVLTELPLGAPVRVDIELKNLGSTSIFTPSKISLKSPYTSGSVKDTANIVRSFRPLLSCLEDQPMAELVGGYSVVASLTLLRGKEGSLFPNSGLHYIDVVVQWKERASGSMLTLKGDCTVFVTTPTTASHARAAHQILTTPDAHLVVALGGDYLKAGISCIQNCLRDPTLAPHYAAIEAKRMATPFRNRHANLHGARDLIYSKHRVIAVMSHTERTKLMRLGLNPEQDEHSSRLDRFLSKAERRLARQRSRSPHHH